MKMKKILALLFVLVPLLVLSQRRPKIKGNRVVTEVNESLPTFNAIELTDDLEIHLKKSYGEGYQITADDNLIDVLKFEVLDGTLMISSYYDIVSKKKLEITVNFVALNAITLRAGKVFGDDQISTETLYLNTFGNADMDIDASAFLVNLNAEDNSKVNLKLDVDTLQVVQRHRSKAYIYSVSGTNIVDLLDNGDMTMEGTTEEMKAKLLANTRLKAQKLESQNVVLHIDENAVARIQAFKNFELNAAGNTKTYLYGNPKISILDFMDTTQLIKKQLE